MYLIQNKIKSKDYFNGMWDLICIKWDNKDSNKEERWNGEHGQIKGFHRDEEKYATRGTFGYEEKKLRKRRGCKEKKLSKRRGWGKGWRR